MKRTLWLSNYPASRPLNADQVIEYHAARLILLCELCGKNAEVQGLTKLAKLDFFVRYPDFFQRAATRVGANLADQTSRLVELPMIRHHYGPWDPRYYEVLAYLESRQLIRVTKVKKTFVFQLTETGRTVAGHLMKRESFGELIGQIELVNSVFGRKTGVWLKDLIYQIFSAEVADIARGEVIG